MIVPLLKLFLFFLLPHPLLVTLQVITVVLLNILLVLRNCITFGFYSLLVNMLNLVFSSPIKVTAWIASYIIVSCFLYFRFRANFRRHMRKGSTNQSELSLWWFYFTCLVIFFHLAKRWGWFWFQILGANIWGLPYFDRSSSCCCSLCLPKVRKPSIVI